MSRPFSVGKQAVRGRLPGRYEDPDRSELHDLAVSFAGHAKEDLAVLWLDRNRPQWRATLGKYRETVEAGRRAAMSALHKAKVTLGPPLEEYEAAKSRAHEAARSSGEFRGPQWAAYDQACEAHADRRHRQAVLEAAEREVREADFDFRERVFCVSWRAEVPVTVSRYRQQQIIGFLDGLLGVGLGNSREDMIVEVKTGAIHASEIVRQIETYRESLPHSAMLLHTQEVTASSADLLLSHDVMPVKLGARFQAWLSSPAANYTGAEL